MITCFTSFTSFYSSHPHNIVFCAINLAYNMQWMRRGFAYPPPPIEALKAGRWDQFYTSYILIHLVCLWQWLRTDNGHGQLFEKKSFFKKPKTSTKHCWITHLCIMHRVHTSINNPRYHPNHFEFVRDVQFDDNLIHIYHSHNTIYKMKICIHTFTPLLTLTKIIHEICPFFSHNFFYFQAQFQILPTSIKNLQLCSKP